MKTARRQVIIFLGAPGAGKTTQVELLARRLGYTPISIGQSLRNQIKINSQLGQQINQITSQGLNVPPEMIFQAIETDLARAPDGIVIDNPFRNFKQLHAWQDYFVSQHLEVRRVFHLVIPETVSYQRQQEQDRERNDTSPKTMIQRYRQGYSANIKSLLEYWRKQNLLSEIDGLQPIDVVAAQVIDCLDKDK